MAAYTAHMNPNKTERHLTINRAIFGLATTKTILKKTSSIIIITIRIKFVGGALWSNFLVKEFEYKAYKPKVI